MHHKKQAPVLPGKAPAKPTSKAGPSAAGQAAAPTKGQKIRQMTSHVADQSSKRPRTSGNMVAIPKVGFTLSVLTWKYLYISLPLFSGCSQDCEGQTGQTSGPQLAG